MKIYPIKKPIRCDIENIASDKSISHRCAIFSLLSDKPSRIRNYLQAEDTLNTLNIIKSLGCKVEIDNGEIIITPPTQIKEPNHILECGNSGTSMRIFMGLLSSVDGFFVLSGDKYLNERPMNRVGLPLIDIGVQIYGREGGNKAPICIQGKKLKYFKYHSKIASAQVKTALILAALRGEGCEFSEIELSRDHSEKMLLGMGADIVKNSLTLEVSPLKKPLKPLNIIVPNDPSSAFFFALAAAIIPGSKIVLKNILLNKTRIEAYKILQKMGTNITFELKSSEYEDVGDIVVEYAPLKAIEVHENISWLIDEAPALAIAFANAKGKSILRNAKELRVKECDRIKATVDGLKNCGIEAEELDDGFKVVGGVAKLGNVDSWGDHRIAMSFAILGIKCGMNLSGSKSINISFPNFKELLMSLGVKVENTTC
ncbi:3-phosphoshikimate 1-carboxyvinyltransferase [Campylobacter blaseri]|uniref:3-phosphoshikimate 1-carboxyvinyltransferase n=1 Tax=Campylobacter blaseri TaxID=2042961 RepID=A0A2P8R0A6_9BACT|nr:3-phosphoshikimate 1-carboxyvinyltransferase [Campylobacter blaseri]PSM51934.1 3-phosphoshikimate 1-carboxyvinyltransferase [Campylobacter blaseri]PSM53718.1 3-phosphoshikimate 1-carboxyvinyltransferase [Campylobacter blaseri]QKF85728.1 3-phosphoshikimate 1-carboxyvinyltransferase [Campylobacter blaseri]